MEGDVMLCEWCVTTTLITLANPVVVCACNLASGRVVLANNMISIVASAPLRPRPRRLLLIQLMGRL